MEYLHEKAKSEIKLETEEQLYQMCGIPPFPGNYTHIVGRKHDMNGAEVVPAHPNHWIRADESRKELLQKGRERERNRRMNETPEQRHERLMKNCERQRIRRLNETPEQRMERLQKGRERERLRRMNESPDERRTRLQKNCDRQRRRRQGSTPKLDHHHHHEEPAKHPITELLPSPLCHLKYPPLDTRQYLHHHTTHQML